MACSQRFYNGLVFSMTNEINNRVVVYRRDNVGMLETLNSYETGGSGTGLNQVDPLKSQGSVILSNSGRLLFVVNSGSNSISSFFVLGNRIILVDVISCCGVMPISLTILEDILYVCNKGDENTPSNVSCFCVSPTGCLKHLPCSTRLLSDDFADPACIVASTNRNKIIVSEKATNRLSVFQVQENGALSRLVANTSNGEIPFGLSANFNGLLFSCEAGPNALSSYLIGRNNSLFTISDSVPSGQNATCWVSVNPFTFSAYTSNTGSGTVSIYEINRDGTLELVRSLLSTRSGLSAPIDNCVDKCGQNLYVLNGNEGSISCFKIEENGNLLLLQVLEDADLPVIGAQGIAAL